jgi:hypothetical protein
LDEEEVAAGSQHPGLLEQRVLGFHVDVGLGGLRAEADGDADLTAVAA